MKKLLSLLLALVCILSITACTDTSSESKGTEKESQSTQASTDDVTDKATDKATDTSDTTPAATLTEADAKLVAESFMAGYTALDSAEMAKYVDNPSEIPDMSAAKSKIESIKTVPSGLEAYSKEWLEIMDIIVGKMYDTLGYSITKTEKTADNEYKFTVKIIMPGTSETEITAALSVISAHFTEDNMKAVASKLANDGVLTNDMTTEQMTEILMKELFKDAKESAKGIEFKTTSMTQALVINMKTGTALVDTKASGM